MRKNISIMIKPSSSKCNLKCKYCFYNSIADERDISDYGFMKDETIEKIMDRIEEYCEGGQCTIGFQGGEPMLIGLDFYKKIVNIAERKKTKFSYFIQTNGTLITEEFAQFFKENNFLVGVSLDGTKDLHDLNRINALSNGSFNDVKKGLDILDKYKVDFNILIVVTSALSSKVEKCYKFLRKNKYNYLQFIPFIPSSKDQNSCNKIFELSSIEYEEVLKKLFDLWYSDVIKGDVVSIRYFDNLLGLFLGYNYEACDMRGVCSCQHIIESDGSVYPCDFYAYEEYSIGNINKDSFEIMHEREVAKNFIISSVTNNDDCNKCKYFSICRGGCKRHREENNDKYVFCQATYNFLEYSYNKFNYLARNIIDKSKQ